MKTACTIENCYVAILSFLKWECTLTWKRKKQPRATIRDHYLASQERSICFSELPVTVHIHFSYSLLAAVKGSSKPMRFQE